MTSLFSHIEVIEDGEIEFGFNQLVAPYVFQLKERFYSFRLSEPSQVRSKYTLALMKLWNANAVGKWSDRDDPNSLPPTATIEGSLGSLGLTKRATRSDGPLVDSNKKPLMLP